MAKTTTRKAYGKALTELAKESRKILMLNVDLSGSIETGEVRKVTPEQHFNFGTAEGNMVAATAGMAASGNIIFASTFAMSATGRVFEQVRNSTCYPHLNVKMCTTHAGFTVDEDGTSHQSVEGVALMRSIPGMVVVLPADGVETKAAVRVVARYDGPCYVRLGKTAVEDVHTEDMLNFQIGKGNVIHKGNSVALIATGVMAEAAMKAADILKENGMDVTVTDVHTIKPIDEELIVKLTKDRDLFVACEEHNVISGLGNAIAEVFSREALEKLAMIGIRDAFGESGAPAALFKKYSLTINDIVKAVEDSK